MCWRSFCSSCSCSFGRKGLSADEPNSHSGARRLGGPARAALRHPRLFSASADPSPAMGIHLYGLVDDGPVRLGLTWPWRLRGRRRLRAGTVWNYFDATPWLGIPLGIALSALLGLIIGYPCFRLRVVGHYFALVTLALGQVVVVWVVGGRGVTGGSLGMTPRSIGHSWYALQFPDKIYFYAIALLVWLIGLFVWRWIDRGIGREALEAISDDEDAAAAIGIDVTREKLRVTIISAALTALGGAVFGQYLMYLNPDIFSGIGVSLQIVFAAIAGGMYAMLGPTVGALFTIALTEGLRVWFGANFVGAANTIYGILLILFVIFMPRGILGWLETVRPPHAGAAAPAE